MSVVLHFSMSVENETGIVRELGGRPGLTLPPLCLHFPSASGNMVVSLLWLRGVRGPVIFVRLLCGPPTVVSHG